MGSEKLGDDRKIIADLVRIVIDGTSGDGFVDDRKCAQGEAAMRRLDPIIRKVAGRLKLFARHNQRLLDFIDESPSIIFEAGLEKFDTSRSFEAWCYQVLRHALIDRFRSSRSDPLAGAVSASPDSDGTSPAEQLEDPASRDSLERLQQAIDLTRALPRRDLRAIANWSPLCRIVLLAMSGLYCKVHHRRWFNWLTDADATPPCPPEHWSAIEIARVRLEVLASRLPQSFSAVKRCWHRYREKLETLQFVQGIR